MDGVPFLSQPPHHASGGTYDYEFPHRQDAGFLVSPAHERIEQLGKGLVGAADCR